MADRALAAVAVVLCVVALALAASTIAASGDVERGAGAGTEPGSSDESRGAPPPSNRTAPDLPDVGAWWVGPLFAVLVALALPAAAVLGLERVVYGLLSIAALGAVLGIIWLVSGPALQDVARGPLPNGTAGLEGGGDSGVAAETGPERSPDAPSVVALGVVGLVLSMAVGLVYYASSSADRATAPDPSVDAAPREPRPVADAAGRAADRIDAHEGEPENAVYAAWVEMTAALDAPDPATSTPGEFADAAVARGMDESRVAALTDLFERVRYGREPVTEAHERRATDLLRRIEAEHGGGDADRTDDADHADDADRTDDRNGGDLS